jgi:hypothetical protein
MHEYLLCTVLDCGSTLMKTSSRHVKPLVIYLWQDGVLSAA